MDDQPVESQIKVALVAARLEHYWKKPPSLTCIIDEGARPVVVVVVIDGHGFLFVLVDLVEERCSRGLLRGLIDDWCWLNERL